ncbi:hypothetical protein E4T44_01328 [Aureobasidium sp. EXF-8845]|nr:hypothetical protein E4T44_01328 [Aureobasidium sp. EXF-8845]KAI4857443.1 hypothetical protein E4T45_01065 [Aureobasidium sp. EXF-8846]
MKASIDSRNPRQHAGWRFQDSEEGTLAASHKEATGLLATSVVFAKHLLLTSARVLESQDKVKGVGHATCMLELHDDKHSINGKLQKSGQSMLPQGWLLVDDDSDLGAQLEYLHLRFPYRRQASQKPFAVTVLPPTNNYLTHHAPLVVTLHNHFNDAASFNDMVAVTANSYALTPEE